MPKPGPHFAFFAPTLVLVLALGPLAFIGDGTGNFPDVPGEIIDDAILKHYSFFAIPLGYSRMTSQGYDCNASVDLKAL